MVFWGPRGVARGESRLVKNRGGLSNFCSETFLPPKDTLLEHDHTHFRNAPRSSLEPLSAIRRISLGLPLGYLRERPWRHLVRLRQWSGSVGHSLGIQQKRSLMIPMSTRRMWSPSSVTSGGTYSKPKPTPVMRWGMMVILGYP